MMVRSQSIVAFAADNVGDLTKLRGKKQSIFCANVHPQSSIHDSDSLIRNGQQWKGDGFEEKKWLPSAPMQPASTVRTASGEFSQVNRLFRK